MSKKERPKPDDPCKRCKREEAKFLVDIHAVVKILGVRLCTRCMHIALRDYPASSAVNLRRYEQ